MVISKTLPSWSVLATWRTKSAVLRWEILPAASAVAGKSGVAGPSYIQMLHDVLDAFARMDIDEADVFIVKIKKSIRNTKVLFVNDDLHDGRFAYHSERTYCAVLARSIERIGDRCQNICEFIFST